MHINVLWFYDRKIRKFPTYLLTVGCCGVYNIWSVQNGTQSLSRVAEGIGPMKPGNLGVTQNRRKCGFCGAEKVLNPTEVISER